MKHHNTGGNMAAIRNFKSSLKEVLLSRGHSISSWSRKNGYNPYVVRVYINRYTKRPQMPSSPKVYEILAKLEKDTGINLMKKAE
jgi:hypothetical protein